MVGLIQDYTQGQLVLPEHMDNFYQGKDENLSQYFPNSVPAANGSIIDGVQIVQTGTTNTLVISAGVIRFADQVVSGLGSDPKMVLAAYAGGSVTVSATGSQYVIATVSFDSTGLASGQTQATAGVSSTAIDIGSVTDTNVVLCKITNNGGGVYTISYDDNCAPNYGNLQSYLENIYGGIFMCNGRLTGINNQPTADTSSSGSPTLYFTPYLGGRISLYNSTAKAWLPQKFSQVAVTVSGALDTDSTYFVYAYSTGVATIGLEFQEWTSGEPTLGTQDGVFVKNGDASKLLIGAVYSKDGTNVFDWDSERAIFNYYNQISKELRCSNNFAGYDYTSSTWRVAGGSSNPTYEDLGVGSVAALFFSFKSKTPISNMQFAQTQIGGSPLTGQEPQIAIGVNNTGTPYESKLMSSIASSGTNGYYGCASFKEVFYSLSGYCRFYRLERCSQNGSVVSFASNVTNNMIVDNYLC